MRAVKILVNGRVQGVFFRVYTEQKAKSMGLHGTVRNQDDGTVLIEAIGGHAEVEELIRWCREEGSPSSEVNEVTVTELRDLRTDRDFRIVR